MEYNLKAFEHVVSVQELATMQYFEFTNTFHTIMHSHDFYEMVFVDTGSIKAISQHFCDTLTQGEMVLHMPNEPHYVETDGSSAPNVIIIGFSVKCDKLNDFCDIKVKLLPPEKRMLVDIIREARSVYLPPYDVPYAAEMKKRANFPYGADQMIQMLLQEFLIKFIRTSEKTIENNDGEDIATTPLVTDICNYIKNNISEDLCIKMLVKLFCINKTTLCKIFKNQTNCTISDYITLERLRQAKILMRENNKTFTQISEILNFSSVHHFSKVFSTYEKLTPTEYVQTIKSKLEN